MSAATGHGIVREYLALRPVGIRGALRLYSCFLLAGAHRLVFGKQFGGAGRYLGGSDPLTVRSDTLLLRARPRTEDLLYLLPGHKPIVARWFTPKPGEHVVDVGAHLGLFSLKAAQSGAIVLAIEPNPATSEILVENLRLNGFASARVERTAVGSASGVGSLEVPPIYQGKASLVPGWATGGDGGPLKKVPVRIASLDDLVDRAGFERIDWLLIDVEGYELEVLRGASRTLARTKTVIIEVSASPGRSECRRILEEVHGLRVIAEEGQTETTDYWRAERPTTP
ncbi:MAG: FkbM family methyltransferase [Thermoplasmata archaeon]|nr:FkbM family methyltransferase [Thermoplasmata archaeon]